MGSDRGVAGAGTADPAMTATGATGAARASSSSSATAAGSMSGAGGSVARGPGSSELSTTEAEAQDLAAAGSSGASRDAATGNWLTDNLLAIVTAALALIVLIIAWVMRRAGARRADEHEDGVDGEQVIDTAALSRQLQGIDLNLDTPPSDESPARNPRR